MSPTTTMNIPLQHAAMQHGSLTSLTYPVSCKKELFTFHLPVKWKTSIYQSHLIRPFILADNILDDMIIQF